MPRWMSQTQQEELEVAAVEVLAVAKVAVIKEEKEDKAARKEVDQHKRSEQKSSSSSSKKSSKTSFRTKSSKIMFNTLHSKSRSQLNLSSFANNSRKCKKTGKDKYKITAAQWAMLRSKISSMRQPLTQSSM